MVAPDPGQVALALLAPRVGVVGVRLGRLVAQVAGPDDLERLGPVRGARRWRPVG